MYFFEYRVYPLNQRYTPRKRTAGSPENTPERKRRNIDPNHQFLDSSCSFRGDTTQFRRLGLILLMDQTSLTTSGFFLLLNIDVYQSSSLNTWLLYMFGGT